MSAKAVELMRAIHGENIYLGYGSALPLDLKGWNSTHKTFVDLITKNRPSIVFDIGVWKGGSTIFMANLLKENGIAGAVVAIDTFLGSPEHWDRTSPDWHRITRRAGRPLLYEQFLTNVLRVGMHDLVVPLPQTSDNAAVILSRLRIRAGLIHIDAAHEYDAVMRDIRTYWELLEPGGYLLGDDYEERWTDVVRAANEFADSVKQKLTVVEPKWHLRKP